jgi:acyl-CoA thioesterase II
MTTVDERGADGEHDGPNGPNGPGGSWVADLLRLDRNGDTFVAPPSDDAFGRLFGGRIAAQALAAAGATVGDDKLPQSLHAYFVRGGRPGVDIVLAVERTRDGRSFDTRQVSVTQEGIVILEMLASFHRPEPDVDWHPPAPAMVDLHDTVAVPMPPDMAHRFEIRVAGPNTSPWPGLPYWIRAHEPLGDDPLSRACALTFMSDMGLMAAARPPGIPFPTGPGKAASLDHAVWFHRPFHADRWHRYDATPLNANDARGLARGAVYDATGTLVATVMQEALWRS